MCDLHLLFCSVVNINDISFAMLNCFHGLTPYFCRFTPMSYIDFVHIEMISPFDSGEGVRGPGSVWWDAGVWGRHDHPTHQDCSHVLSRGGWGTLITRIHGYSQSKQNRIYIFSSPEHKVLRVSYCDRPLSVVVRKPFYLNISSETTHWILTKLHRNDPWVVPYQSCSNGSDWLHK